MFPLRILESSMCPYEAINSEHEYLSAFFNYTMWTKFTMNFKWHCLVLQQCSLIIMHVLCSIVEICPFTKGCSGYELLQWAFSKSRKSFRIIQNEMDFRVMSITDIKQWTQQTVRTGDRLLELYFGNHRQNFKRNKYIFY